MSQAAPGDHIPHTPNSSVAKLTLGAIGVVYGDIGTSPLYAMRESLHAASHDGLTRGDVLGVISLLVWTLTLIVTLKYVLLIMRADNNGEGGTLSLVALVQRALNSRPTWLIAFGAAIKAFIGYGHAPFTASFFFRSHAGQIAELSAWITSITGFSIGPIGTVGVALSVVGMDKLLPPQGQLGQLATLSFGA